MSTNTVDKVKELLGKVDTKWHDPFWHFVKTGEASVEFWKVLGEDDYIQEACDLMFEEQVNGFETLVKAMQDAVKKGVV